MSIEAQQPSVRNIKAAMATADKLEARGDTFSANVIRRLCKSNAGLRGEIKRLHGGHS
jgi:hypothetical protein